MNLTEEQKSLFLERYLKQKEYSKEYYKQYQKDNKESVNNNTRKYLDKIKNDEEKLQEYKQKKKDYYLARGKELSKIRYEKNKLKKKNNQNNLK
jgi:fructoselysine-6-P-deglycase FrlB-like protein